jgi:transposase
MIQITAQMRVLVAIEPVDGRKGIDSLARLCQEKLAEDPFSGCVFVFRSRSGTAIRLLSYDGQGYWLAQKRLSRGRFVWWPEGSGAAKSHLTQVFGRLLYETRVSEEELRGFSEDKLKTIRSFAKFLADAA